MPELMDKPEKKPVDLHYQRARRSWRSRFAADYRHWVRRTFSRESYINSLKALLWVVPLSALIWSYAFNEQFEATRPITVNLALNQDADRVVRFIDDRRSVIAILDGPQKDIAAIEDYLRANTLKLEVDRGLGTGRHQVDVLYALNHDRRVTQAGMTVKSCEPDQITVDVDTIVPRKVDVMLRPDEPKTMRATFTPAQVTLFGPKQQLDSAMPTVIYVNPKSYEPFLKLKPVGISSIPVISLEIPSGLDATTTPSTVRAEIEVTGAEVNGEIPPISALAEVPVGATSDSFKVKCDPRVVGVKIIGPKPAVDAISRGEIGQLRAVFVPTYENPGIKRSATVEFLHMPAGVRLADEPPKIEYTVEDRT